MYAHQRSRPSVPELLDQLRAEFDNLVHEANAAKLARDDIDRKRGRPPFDHVASQSEPSRLNRSLNQRIFQSA
jgi:hypothetical protein